MDSEGGGSTRLTFLGADTATVVRIVAFTTPLTTQRGAQTLSNPNVAGLVHFGGPSALSPFVVTGHYCKCRCETLVSWPFPHSFPRFNPTRPSR